LDDVVIITAILTLVAGIGVFLTACSMLSSNIESVSSKRMKTLFSKASKSKLSGVGIGAVVTAAIQSSGATTIMVMGFVNAAVMSLPLAATIVFGSKIGTTITAQIAAFGMVGDSISMAAIFAAFAGIGACMTFFSGKENVKIWGGLITGFGLLFVGLAMMTDSMSGFAQMESVKQFLASIDNIVLLLFFGIGLSALAQSSSVVTTLLIAMLVTGLIDLEQGIYLALGSNIGACVPVLLAGWASTDNAKRVSLILLIFNIIGVTVLTIAGLLMGTVGITYSGMFDAMFPGAPATALAMFHTISNVVFVIIMLPLTNWLVRVLFRLVPERKGSDKKGEPHLYYLDEYMLKNPPLALQQAKKEVLNMADMAMDNYRLAIHMVTTMDFSEKKHFIEVEDELNYLDKEISRYMVMLSEHVLSDKDQIYVSTVYHTTCDLERIGDYAKNIVEYAEKMDSLSEGFSEMALAEIDQLRILIDDLYGKIRDAYENADRVVLEQAYLIEDKVDDITSTMATNHVHRLNQGQCTLDVGSEFLSLTSDSERVADHLINMGKTIKLYA